MNDQPTEETPLRETVTQLWDRAMVEDNQHAGHILHHLSICMIDPDMLESFYHRADAAFKEVLDLYKDESIKRLEIHIRKLIHLCGDVWGDQTAEQKARRYINGLSVDDRIDLAALYSLSSTDVPLEWDDARNMSSTIPSEEIATQLSANPDLSMYLRIGFARYIRQWLQEQPPADDSPFFELGDYLP